MLVVSEKGFGKRTLVEEYRITNRGGKGVKTINVTDKTGCLVGILDVSEKEDLMITCKSGITIRTSISNIREAGRATQGVKLMRLDDGDNIAAITKLDEVGEMPAEEQNANPDLPLNIADQPIIENDEATTDDNLSSDEDTSEDTD